MPSSTRTGVFGMTRTTGVPSARRSSKKEVGMPAARADDQAVGGDVRGELVQEGAHVLRLDGEDQGVGGLGRLGVADGLDAVAGAQFLGALRAAGGDEEVGGRPAGPDHSGEQGLADLAGAEDCDLLRRRGRGGRGGHRGSPLAVRSPCTASSFQDGGARARGPPGGTARGRAACGGAARSRRAAAQGGRAEAEDEQGAAGHDRRGRVRSRRSRRCGGGPGSCRRRRTTWAGRRRGRRGRAACRRAGTNRPQSRSCGKHHGGHELDGLELAGREGADEQAEGGAEEGVERGRPGAAARGSR